jgi:hypothetical protein
MRKQGQATQIATNVIITALVAFQLMQWAAVMMMKPPDYVADDGGLT